jgi:excisionase family DNA binding protein
MQAAIQAAILAPQLNCQRAARGPKVALDLGTGTRPALRGADRLVALCGTRTVLPSVAMAIKPQSQLTDLHAYGGAFVTVRQLSEYWDVSRKHVLKLIESGLLESIRLGPKTYRVPVQAAVAFEYRNRSRRESRAES